MRSLDILISEITGSLVDMTNLFYFVWHANINFLFAQHHCNVLTNAKLKGVSHTDWTLWCLQQAEHKKVTLIILLLFSNPSVFFLREHSFNTKHGFHSIRFILQNEVVSPLVS